MRIRVLYFGIISDMARRKEEDVDLPDHSTTADLIEHLSASNPNFAPLARQVRPVSGGKNISREHPLQDGDEVAFMRAIGGG